MFSSDRKQYCHHAFPAANAFQDRERAREVGENEITDLVILGAANEFRNWDAGGSSDGEVGVGVPQGLRGHHPNGCRVLLRILGFTVDEQDRDVLVTLV